VAQGVGHVGDGQCDEKAFEAFECDTVVQSRAMIDGWECTTGCNGTVSQKSWVVTFRHDSVADRFRCPTVVPHDLPFFSLFFSSFATVSRARPFFVPLCFFLFTLYLQLSCGEFSRLDAQSAVGASSFLII
jgi:hypothetical protein